MINSASVPPDARVWQRSAAVRAWNGRPLRSLGKAVCGVVQRPTRVAGPGYAHTPARMRVRMRTRSYAANVKVKSQPTFSRPRCCSLRKPPMVLPHP